MTALTAAKISNPGLLQSLDFSRNRESNRGTSLSKLTKTVGVLALLLSGGARAENPPVFQGNRRLLIGHLIATLSKNYEYASVCDNDIAEARLNGTSYEDCMAQEEVQLDAMQERKEGRLGLLKRCYTISGYLSAAMFGTSFVSCAAVMADERVRGGVPALGLGVGGTFALVPTIVCGIGSNIVKGNIKGARLEAKECCDNFPTQEELAASTGNTDNSTLVSTPPPANNSMPINGTADSARR